MADTDCISTCAVCAGDMAQPPRGRKRRYCSVECRTRAASTSFRGMTQKKGRRRKLVSWCCSRCGEEKQLKPCEAKSRQFCSVECRAAARKVADHGPFTCKGCHSTFYRKRRRDDAGEYCSRDCFFQALDRVANECRAIRRIGERHRDSAKKSAEDARKAVVLPEIHALRRIARKVNAANKKAACPCCGREFRRRRKFQRFCSRDCRSNHRHAIRSRYKESEVYKRYRRAAKSRRRALMRGVIADRIDPIKVFERDRWQCHLCGIKTLRSLRGTREDRAPELEHIVSLADGGTHTWGNVACSCRRCNQEKGAESRGQLGLAMA